MLIISKRPNTQLLITSFSVSCNFWKKLYQQRKPTKSLFYLKDFVTQRSFQTHAINLSFDSWMKFSASKATLVKLKLSLVFNLSKSLNTLEKTKLNMKNSTQNQSSKKNQRKKMEMTLMINHPKNQKKVKQKLLNLIQAISNGPRQTINQRTFLNYSKEWRVSIPFMSAKKLKHSEQIMPNKQPNVLTNFAEDFKILTTQTSISINRSSSNTEKISLISDHFIKTVTQISHTKTKRR